MLLATSSLQYHTQWCKCGAAVLPVQCIQFNFSCACWQRARKHSLGGHRGPNYWHQPRAMMTNNITRDNNKIMLNHTTRRVRRQSAVRIQFSADTSAFCCSQTRHFPFYFSLIEWFNFAFWLSHSCDSVVYAYQASQYLTACGWINAIIHFIFRQHEFCSLRLPLTIRAPESNASVPGWICCVAAVKD